MKNYDYGQNGACFVTINTHHKKHYFGEIVQIETQDVASQLHTITKSAFMQLSRLGQVAQACWSDIPNHFPFVKLGEFVIMPNHVHGILIFTKHNHSEAHG